jgi:hypothetical protein
MVLKCVRLRLSAPMFFDDRVAAYTNMHRAAPDASIAIALLAYASRNLVDGGADELPASTVLDAFKNSSDELSLSTWPCRSGLQRAHDGDRMP